ncbi:hypothetical protein P43SY_007755 [Pythium insidiosum]|uniref:Uncharacterized protein n=1 Tax=Pythium insidiosum TaxID=114742 RepID=A0AAD5LY75_PYTIN|nr:hypothetical protein P43SY_007755 [Pythium insidiosum]
MARDEADKRKPSDVVEMTEEDEEAIRAKLRESGWKKPRKSTSERDGNDDKDDAGNSAGKDKDKDALRETRDRLVVGRDRALHHRAAATGTGTARVIEIENASVEDAATDVVDPVGSSLSFDLSFAFPPASPTAPPVVSLAIAIAHAPSPLFTITVAVEIAFDLW